MKKVALISGITGQDGSFLAEFLIDKGYEVHGILRRSSSFNTGRIEHLYLDEWVRDMTFKVLYTYKLAYAEERCQQISQQIQTLQQEHPEADYESYQPLLQELSTWQEIRRMLGQFSGQRVVIS